MKFVGLFIFCIAMLFPFADAHSATTVGGGDIVENCTAPYKWCSCAFPGYKCDEEKLKKGVCVSPGTECTSDTVRTNCGCFDKLGCPTICPNADWTDSEFFGYQSRCRNNLCQHQCAPGFFGTPEYDNNTKSLKGCIACKDATNNANATSDASTDTSTTLNPINTNIENCYLPKYTGFSEAAGSGIFTEKCYYNSESKSF